MTLTGRNTATPSFTAPSATGTLEFRGHGDREGYLVQGARYKDTASVTVTVGQACGDSHHGALRLAGENRRSDREGRLEICINDDDPDTTDGWGVICDDYWTQHWEANLACRQLGFVGTAAGATPQPGTFGEVGSNVPIWLDNITCRGGETSLLDCPRRADGPWNGGDEDQITGFVENLGLGDHNCNRGEAVGVICTMTPQPSHRLFGSLLTQKPELAVTVAHLDERVCRI